MLKKISAFLLSFLVVVNVWGGGFSGGIVTPLPVNMGGTGATTAANARTALGAAESGANTSITSIGGLTTALTVAQGGTGVTSHPCFSAYQTAVQTLTAGTWTKVVLNVKEFDTASAFDNVTNYRFQPTVAGYYTITGGVGFNAVGSSVAVLYKNGALYKSGGYAGANGTNQSSNVASVVYMNGSTDYIELFVYSTAGLSLLNSLAQTFLNGCFLGA